MSYASEQAEIEAILGRAEAENKAEEAKTKAKQGDALVAEAKFLKKWAKGKPIVRQSAGSTFWAAGKWMTKLAFPTVDALVAAGLADLQGDSKQAGARLVMK
jgi:hypothetical protein